MIILTTSRIKKCFKYAHIAQPAVMSMRRTKTALIATIPPASCLRLDGFQSLITVSLCMKSPSSSVTSPTINAVISAPSCSLSRYLAHIHTHTRTHSLGSHVHDEWRWVEVSGGFEEAQVYSVAENNVRQQRFLRFVPRVEG